jgi:hypothetical protein
MAYRAAVQSDYRCIEPVLNVIAHWVQRYRAAVAERREPDRVAARSACGCELSRHEPRQSSAETVTPNR